MTGPIEHPAVNPRTVLVTGAAGGIGRVLVRALLAWGHCVAAVDREDGGLQELRDLPGGRDEKRLALLPADLRLPGVAEELVARTQHLLGPADTVINNAGIGGSGFWQRLGRPRPLFWQVEPELWDEFMQINAGAAFRVARAAVPGLVASGRGRIINVTTSLLTMLESRMVPYGPSKAAAEALTAIMAADLSGTGVTANVVVPGGPTDTPMVTGVDKSRLLPPEVMVLPLLWLLSDEAAATTGQRFVAARWDAGVRPSEAAAAAGAPVAWMELALQGGRTGDALN
jgi:NAD(P)-dependent dehydrogenase (short-subunit alcohol dehydrogenase family)